MSLGWLGTFRQGQWKAFRRIALNERRDLSRRIAVIEAEIARIGQVTVFYGMTPEGVMTEERIGFTVSSGSVLEKLFQAYTAQGGNPFDVSMFLYPDSTLTLTIEGEDITQDMQPYGGVIYAKSQLPGLGIADEGGYLNLKKYWPARSGGVKEFQDSTVANAVDLVRRSINPTIRHRIHDLEAKILKQCDLREQLQQEIDLLTISLSGIDPSIPESDTNLYSPKFNITKIVNQIDNIVFASVDGVPDLDQANTNAGPNPGGPVSPDYQSIFTDIVPDEDNTAL